MTFMSIVGDAHPISGLAAFAVAMFPWLILFSFWGFAHAFRARSSRKAATLMAEAAERFAHGDDAAAACKNARVLDLDPACAQAFILRGMILSQAYRFQEAIKDFDRAIALMPRSTLAIYRRAIAKHCLDDLDGAIADYDRLMALEPSCADSQPGMRRKQRTANR